MPASDCTISRPTRRARTGEWQQGVGRLLSREIDLVLAILLRPYLSVLSALNGGGALTRYAGSPRCIRRFNGTGLVVCNPPWKFEETLNTLLQGLWPHLADGPGAGKSFEVITGE